MISNSLLESYVDTDNGLISPHLFSSQELYELEMDRIFGRSWLFLAHESQIPKPGDYFSTYMGGDPVIVVRQKDGTIKAFLNYCRHRGMPICRADQGNTRAFSCSYHGWSYDVTGKLVSVPNMNDAYRNQLDKSQWGLKEVPRLEMYAGLIFGCFDESIPSLDDYLGDMKFHMDITWARREGGVEFVGGVSKNRIMGNWKMASEQLISDSYHAQITHLSSISVFLPPELANQRDISFAFPGERGRQFSSPFGHGTGYDPDMAIPWMAIGGHPILDEYEESIRPEREARLGVERARIGPLHAGIFPSFSWLGGSRTCRVLHPKGPNEFEFWVFCFVDKAAPDEVKNETRRTSQSVSGSAGLIEQDDGEAWAAIGENLANRGPQAHKLPFNYEMGMGQGGKDPTSPGHVMPHLFSEEAARSFYRRWRDLMTITDKWPMPIEVVEERPNGTVTEGNRK
jgi:3-phenylpropionate/trans-cinnamate dioxygenase subunit alpha